jgi:hypothetical protein
MTDTPSSVRLFLVIGEVVSDDSDVTDVFQSFGNSMVKKINKISLVDQNLGFQGSQYIWSDTCTKDGVTSGRKLG